MKLDKTLLTTKLKAAGVHLSLSLIVFFILAYQVFYVWYPQPYFSVDGGWQGMRIIAAVDLVLGPVITFLIFDLSKKRREIAFDLFIIATIQIGALIYGVVTTYEQRPVAIVLIDDFVVPAMAADYASQLDSINELNRYSAETPPIIYAELPLDRTVLDEVTRIKLEEKILEYAQVQLYQSASRLKEALRQRQLRFYERLDLVGHRAGFDRWLAKNQQTADQVLIAPFNGRYGQVWIVFDQNARYLSYF